MIEYAAGGPFRRARRGPRIGRGQVPQPMLDSMARELSKPRPAAWVTKLLADPRFMAKVERELGTASVTRGAGDVDARLADLRRRMSRFHRR
jgi:hypothetical protein